MNLRRTFVLSASVGSLLALSRGALAAGTSLDVQSGRGTGMASSMTAMIDDSSAIFYNPAGIAQGRTIDAMIGDSFIAPSFSYTTPSGQKTSLPFKVLPPFQAYVSGGITDDLSVGVGVFTPFGLTVAWPGGWVGRSLITHAQLTTYDINPTVAYKLGPLRLGAGLQIMRATVDLMRDIGVPGGYAHTELGAGSWGFGGNLGAQIEAIPRLLSFGLQYRSAVPLDFDGSAHFTGVPESLAGTIHDQAVHTHLTNPDSFTFGAALRPIDGLVVDADVTYYGWVRFSSIDITFPNDTTGTLSTSQPKNWTSTLNYHLGAEYSFDETWSIRGGVMFDPCPTPSNTLTPDIPDATRINLAIGGTYRHSSGVHLDLGYQHLILITKTSTAPQLPGDYGGFADILGVSLGYSSRTPQR